MLKSVYQIKAVIFDMDGVITNTMPDHYDCWREILHKEGVPVTYEDIYSREGQRGIHSVRELFEKYKKKYEEDLLHHILGQKEEMFKLRVRQRFIRGARSFLRDLYRRGFRLALVTGTSRHELHKILPEDLYKLFTVVVTGNDVTHGKPHPEPYLKAIAQLNIKPTEAVVLENAPFGIESAKKAGLDCLALKTSLPENYLKKADGIFSTFKELKTKIKFILI